MTIVMRSLALGMGSTFVNEVTVDVTYDSTSGKAVVYSGNCCCSM